MSIVAQLPVPGWQTVTLVVSMLRVRPGAVVTVIGWTFGVFDCGTEVAVLETAPPAGVLAPDGPAALGLLAGLSAAVCDEPAEPPLPPPQPTSAAQTRSRAWGKA
ncbi:hypothetical protein GCM10011400_04940 [Paraburkholderia caffeinilytica]|uniref:Uncharacterized protein n=1 Tax=Paraburkholderia caffeinilytica TaxID=1761016 RepID=A0ABQ1L9E2_9BURK|nr:hypothetical protein GCM10011400_04940 [Paraburkholderia caffeinilytica]